MRGCVIFITPVVPFVSAVVPIVTPAKAGARLRPRFRGNDKKTLNLRLPLLHGHRIRACIERQSFVGSVQFALAHI